MLSLETLSSEVPIAVHIPTLNHEVEEVSPARRSFLTQRVLIRILRQKAKSMPLVSLRYNCGVISLAHHAKKITARTNFGKVIATYCVGCDGSNGVTRKYVSGNHVSGRGLLSKSMTVVFQVYIRSNVS
jgi:2-polyprenyl-6-methoxyphenol hydroxylase-like FAD-dependent oxidoreductase